MPRVRATPVRVSASDAAARGLSLISSSTHGGAAAAAKKKRGRGGDAAPPPLAAVIPADETALLELSRRLQLTEFHVAVRCADDSVATPRALLGRVQLPTLGQHFVKRGTDLDVSHDENKLEQVNPVCCLEERDLFAECRRRGKEAWLYVSALENESFIYFEGDEPVDWDFISKPTVAKSGSKKRRRTDEWSWVPSCSFGVVPVAGNLPIVLFDALKMKSQFTLYLVDEDGPCLRVFLNDSQLLSDIDPCEDGASRNLKALIAFQHFFGISSREFVPVSDVDTKRHDNASLYRQVKERHRRNADYDRHRNFPVRHCQLLPSLRPYQVDAVRWMLSREDFFPDDKNDVDEMSNDFKSAEKSKFSESPAFIAKVDESQTVSSSNADANSCSKIEEASFSKFESLDDKNNSMNHPLWQHLTLPNGLDVFLQPWMGYVTTKKPVLARIPRGGILADEMGLGKTVEVLATVLINQRPNHPLSTLSSVKLEPISSSPEEEPKPNDLQSNNDAVEEEPKPNDLQSNNNAVEEKNDSSVSIPDVVSTEKTEVEPEVEVVEEKPKRKRKPAAKNPKAGKKMAKKGKKEDKKKKSSNRGELLKALQASYLMQLSAYNGTRAVTESAARAEKNRGFFVTKVSRGSERNFECLCGKDEGSLGKKVVCTKCSLAQHAACVDAEHETSGYICPHCRASCCDPLPSGATLIVTPASIAHQWVDEVNKHVLGLDVLMYNGLLRQGYISPAALAKKDVVITTYEALAQELRYVDLQHPTDDGSKVLRAPKRYMTTPSPITSVDWWRLCLDEAQMVEAVLSPTAVMARRIPAQLRWCVTGTPVQRSLRDVYGLFAFLDAEPWARWRWFEQLLLVSSVDLVAALARVLWRTCKKDVLHELQIPSRTDTVHRLYFSAVEEHYYRSLHLRCSQAALSKIASLPPQIQRARLGELHPNLVKNLMAPLAFLRLACCHPSLVTSSGDGAPRRVVSRRGVRRRPEPGNELAVGEGSAPSSSAYYKCGSVHELLDQLLRRTKVEAEEMLRSIASAANGLAGLSILKEDTEAAVAQYKLVLKMASEFEESLHMDSFQRLHAIQNLCEILPEGEDDKVLRDKADAIRLHLTGKAKQALAKAQNALETSRQAVEKLRDESAEELGNHIVQNWLGMILRPDADTNKLLAFIEAELGLEKKPSFVNEFNRSRHVSRLSAHLGSELNKAEILRTELVALMELLAGSEPRQLVTAAVECHLRPEPKPEKKKTRGGKGEDEEDDVDFDEEEENSTKEQCMLCDAHDKLEEYEELLFDVRDKKKGHKATDDVTLFGDLRRATWKPSKVDGVMKAVVKFGRQFSSKGCEAGAACLKISEAMRKEFRPLRNVWSCVFDSVSVQDEMTMCVSRLEIGRPEDFKTKKGNKQRPANIVLPAEIDLRAVEFVNTKIASEEQLVRKHAHLKYLRHLKASGFGSSRDSHNDEPCPICRQELGRQWALLPCAHCFCLDCCEAIMHRARLDCLPGSNFKCPVCRQVASRNEVSYVMSEEEEKDVSGGKKDEEDEDEGLDVVVGDHCTKIRGLVLQLKRLRRKDPEAKSIVFCSWHAMLVFARKALEENDIPLSFYAPGRQAEKPLRQFKSDPRVAVLLMHTAAGSKGLNLTEANHVFFLDQLLNPGQELQAIGRIDRIGQTKPTFVHRFVIARTIEESLDAMLQSHRDHHLPPQPNTDNPQGSDEEVRVKHRETEEEGEEKAEDGDDDANSDTALMINPKIRLAELKSLFTGREADPEENS
ncbi:unnamed protein product [Notodromas monacha]|uniref:E3 ubiquitin-protein ligase SHPRH n=1 Tax=Notodromas monacha TaxID=399045 RepID=A0A7R9BER8_9CRUS|nr:unnamed protein product [Notodromas monacha]CAG0914037.1 unnamed protein product [Notodromas monacha]